MKNVLASALDVKEELEKDSRIIALKKAEQAMEENEEVMGLSYRFNVAQDEYNDALRHFQEQSPEVKKAQKKLFVAKKALDEHPLVQNYLVLYSQVRQLYETIDEQLFAPFTKHKCEKK